MLALRRLTLADCAAMALALRGTAVTRPFILASWGFEMKRILLKACALTVLGCTVACAPADDHDIVIRDGTIMDGSGTKGIVGDVAIDDDKITLVGMVNGRGKIEINATLKTLRVSAEGTIAIVIGLTIAAVILGSSVKFLTNWL